MQRFQLPCPRLRLDWRIVACLALVSWFLTSDRFHVARAAAPAKHVVIVSLDGLAAYLLDDEKAPLPTVRKLAREGVVIDGGMRVSNPAVTWPNHTTLVTGVRPEKHGVLANGVLVRGGVGSPVMIDPRRDKRDLVRGVTLYEVAKQAGLTTAEVNWPCTRGEKSLDDSFPDVPDAVTHMTPRLRAELVAGGILTDETGKNFVGGSGPGRDFIWTETACHLIRTRRPNLLLVHLLNVDSTHHALGPQSAAGYTANALIDTCLAKILAALDEAGIRQETAVFVLADHGFTLTPKAIRPNAVLRKQGLLTMGRAGKIDSAQVHVVSEGGIGLVYITDPGQEEAHTKRVRELMADQEGVVEILTPSRYAEFGLPHPREYSQSPDLILVAKDGYAVSSSADGDEFVCTNVEGKTSLGSHGFLSTVAKMNALCVLHGAGVRQGVHIKGAENIDIAPTAARLLGLHKFTSDGHVLPGALAE